MAGPANAQRLLSGDTIVETQTRNPVLRLLPQNAHLRQLLDGIIPNLNPSLAVETLSLYKKPGISANSSSAWTENQRLALFNRMLAISTLTGIQYYSASRRVMRTFYESSARIDSPATKNPLPDMVFTEIPEVFVLYARQKDLTFGDNVYTYEFSAKDDAIFFVQLNETPLNYGIIQAVGGHRLRSVFAIIDCSDSLLLYAISMARAASMPGFTDRIGNSFGNRAQAILKWFRESADSVFLTE
jgi:hypothetical protein